MLKKVNTFGIIVVFLTLFSCSIRLVDFTVISSKNHSIEFKLEEGVATKGSSMGVFHFGADIKDAMDKALDNAGPQYDVIVNGVIRTKSYYFYGGYVVEGTAVNSKKLLSQLGKNGFEEWEKRNNILKENTAVSQK